MKNIFKRALVTCSVAILSLIFAQSAFAEIMVFVGDGCPHCAVVEQYLKDNDLYTKLGVKTYEVWYNQDNQALYQQKAKEVGYAGGGVPFLVDGTQYSIGDSPIIAYLDGKLNTNPTAEVPAEIQNANPAPEPPTAPKTLTKDDSKELNNIIQDKIDNGEGSKVNDPETLYDARNGVSEDSGNSKMKVYTGVGIGIVVVAGGVFYFTKKKKRK